MEGEKEKERWEGGDRKYRCSKRDGEDEEGKERSRKRGAEIEGEKREVGKESRVKERRIKTIFLR